MNTQIHPPNRCLQGKKTFLYENVIYFVKKFELLSLGMGN
jgi:hypothetical protein